MNEVDPLLDESTLRRALRLEADERLPRLDAAALALAAEGAGVRERRATLLSAFAVVATASVAAALAGVFDGLPLTLIALLSLDPLDAAILGMEAVAVPIDAVVRVAMQPAVPLAILAAALVALATERTRERSPHVPAS
jgi:hypothetical protein